MNQRSSASARIAAAAALAIAAIAIVVVVAAGLGGGSSGSGKGSRHGKAVHHGQARRSAPATYTVQSGDTLVGIAHKTGVPVARIESLNPQVDPQILIAGEELKLK